MYLTENRIKKIHDTLEKFRIKSSDSECYGWSGAAQDGIYPKIYIDGNVIGINRAAWMLHFGRIPKHRYIINSCNNKLCTNPNHLKTSTHKRIKPEKKKTSRLGRLRLNIDLPTRLVKEVKKMATKYNQTVTKYVGKRLSEVIAYEKRLEEK